MKPSRALRTKRPAICGFTLIELIVTLVVVVVLVAVGLPGMAGLVQNNRLTTSTNKLVSSLYLARSEAISRNGPVSVCAVDTGGGDWARGWFVAVGEQCNPAQALRMESSAYARLSSVAPRIVFRGDGSAPDVIVGRPAFELVNASFRREIYVDRSGHVRTERPQRQSAERADAES